MSKFIPPQKLPLIFASEFMSKACAFGFRGANQEKILNSMIEGTDAEMVLLCDRDATMARPRDITVYSFQDPVTGQTLYHGMADASGDAIRPSDTYGAPIHDDIQKKLESGYAGFVDLPYMQRQCVSSQPVPFSKTKVVLHARTAEDMMRAGLQILIFKESFLNCPKYDDIARIAKERGITETQYLGELVRKAN
jgi:hypothetical protein